MENLKKTLENLSKFDKDCCYFTAGDEETSIIDSKIGGTPYIPKNKELPVSNTGEELRLIAQINFEQIKSDVFELKTGILQVFGSDDDLYGADFDKRQDQNKWRILYHEKIEEYFTREELEEKYKSLTEEAEFFPMSISDCMKLSAEVKKCKITIDDYEFEQKFFEEYNKINPENTQTSSWDIIYNEENDEFKFQDMFEEMGGHKFMGYPSFTQVDPRTYLDDEYVLLLQIDTDEVGNMGILWGDLGIANWFIRPSDLKALDFSKVIFNWDCG